MKLLIEKLAKPATLYRAWEQINRSNLQSRGIDDQTIQDFDALKSKAIPEIAEQLKAGKYVFSDLRARPIEKGKKGDGSPKWRPIQIPAVRDRVVQKATLNVIKPDLEKEFGISKKPNSFAYIKTRSDAPKKGVQAASDTVLKFFEQGNQWVFKGDIKGFFDAVDRDLLFEKVFGALRDDSLNEMIKASFAVDVGNRRALIDMEGFTSDELQELYPNLGTGIPQGGILSPTFSNIVLAPLDDAFIKGGFNSVRYADDFMVLTKTKREAERAYELARGIIEDDLKLKLHEVSYKVSDQSAKSLIAPLHNVEFLGIRHVGKHRYPSAKAFSKMTQRLRTIHTTNDSLARKLYLLQALSTSWGATYWYTSSNLPAEYRALNKELMAALKRIFTAYGLGYTGKLTGYRLRQLGISLFNQSVDRARAKQERKNKEEHEKAKKV